MIIYTLERRWKQHVNAANRGSNLRFHEAIRKHGTDVWEHIILETCDSREHANERELFWMCEIHTIERSKGYNLTHHTTSSHQKFDDEHREKIRQATKRFWNSPDAESRREQLIKKNKSDEGRTAASEAQKRRWSDPHQKDAMSKRHKGKIVSEETRKKSVIHFDIITTYVIVPMPTFESQERPYFSVLLEELTTTRTVRASSKPAEPRPQRDRRVALQQHEQQAVLGLRVTP